MKFQRLHAKIKLKSKKIVPNLWKYTIVIGCVFFCAWFFSKWIESIFFCVAYTAIWFKFDKNFHFRKSQFGKLAVPYCLSASCVVLFFGILIVLPVSKSLLSSVPISIALNWVGYIIADRIDLYIGIKCIKKNMQTKNIYVMSDDELRLFGASKHLSHLQQDILVLVVKQNYRIIDIMKERNYGRSTIKYHLKKIEEKIKQKL